MITLRDGVRKKELPALKKSIEGGASPVAVAREFKLQLPVAIGFFKDYNANLEKFEAELIDANKSPHELAVDNVTMRGAIDKQQSIIHAKDKRITDLLDKLKIYEELEVKKAPKK